MTTSQIKRVLIYFLLVLLAAIPPFAAYWLFDGREAESDAVASLAGKNFRELKRVLDHYSRDPADTLKLKVARLLMYNIKNPSAYGRYC